LLIGSQEDFHVQAGASNRNCHSIRPLGSRAAGIGRRDRRAFDAID
jgi:hypothetical protein